MKKRLAILPIFILLLLVSCGHFQIGESPMDTYLKTRMQFNTIWMRYLDYYDGSHYIMQEKWKKEIDPKFTLANKALNAWGKALKEGVPTYEKQMEFMNLKNELIDLLIPIFVKDEDKDLLKPSQPMR